MDQTEKDKLSPKAKSILDNLEKEGGSVFNWHLKGLTAGVPGSYYQGVGELVGLGIAENGPGPSGSLYLTGHTYSVNQVAFPISYPDAAYAPEKPAFKETQSEAELYRLMKGQLEGPWLDARHLTPSVFVQTANRQSMSLEGKWSVPDFVIAAVRTHEFVPGVDLEIVTIEAKPLKTISVECVFEAASHRTRATRSYVALHVPDEITDKDMKRDMEVITEQCIRQGIGLIRMHDPSNIDFWTTVFEGSYSESRPSELNKTPSQLFKTDEKVQLTKLLAVAKKQDASN